MPHVKHHIRVKRHGSGHGKVGTDPHDKTIGETKTTLHWVRRQDSDPKDPGDSFEFDVDTPLQGLPDPPFKVTKREAHKVTVAYAGFVSKGPTEWKYTITVRDLPLRHESDGEAKSDGPATIRNHD